VWPKVEYILTADLSALLRWRRRLLPINVCAHIRPGLDWRLVIPGSAVQPGGDDISPAAALAVKVLELIVGSTHVGGLLARLARINGHSYAYLSSGWTHLLMLLLATLPLDGGGPGQRCRSGARRWHQGGSAQDSPGAERRRRQGGGPHRGAQGAGREAHPGRHRRGHQHGLLRGGHVRHGAQCRGGGAHDPRHRLEQGLSGQGRS
jgi:hypothetical protein